MNSEAITQQQLATAIIGLVTLIVLIIAMLKNPKLRPFRRPDWLEGLPEAELEANLGSWSVSAIKAMHVGIVINGVIFVGLMFFGLRFIPAAESPVTTTNIVDVIRSITLEEIPGLLAMLLLVTRFFNLLSEFYTRFMVQLWGFTVSVQPGSIIRNYVYTSTARVWLLFLALMFTGPFMFLWYFGTKGLLGFLSPRFGLSFPASILLAIGFASFAAFILFPAMRTRLQDDEELLRLLTFNALTIGSKTYLEMKKEVLKIAVPHLAGELLNDLRRRGPEALADWSMVGPEYFDKVAESFQIPKTKLAELGARNVLISNPTTGPRGGRTRLIGVDDGEQVTVYHPDQLRDTGVINE